tara:strand:- start:1032 stop:2000 length:969 start_codon:yes stop_codon:yes gene_type:complete
MNSKSWDKVLLLAVALVVIGLSGLFVVKALSYGETFVMEDVRPDDELPDTDTGTAELAQSFVEKREEWKNPSKGAPPKPVPLFVSITIVESSGELIDMLDPNAPILREPVTNSWLMNNNLDFLNSGVLLQDPDGDGFDSMSEWDAKTDPSDAASHPPYADKLEMIDRKQTEYKLRFAARPDDERFQIMRLPTAKWPRGDNFYLKVGESSDDGQFRVDSFEEKKAMNNVGIEADASEITITFLPTKEQHVLVRKADYVVPTYYVLLNFLLDSSEMEPKKEGEAFNLPLDLETKYRVIKVNENSVIIIYQTGSEPEQTVEIKKK